MKKQQGFTIIEVVLVLAIAGLIFLMVFIALPALQRGQRDTARKNDVSTVASAVNTYRSNNKGSLAGIDTAKVRALIDALSQYDKNAPGEFEVITGTVTSDTPVPNKMKVYPGKKCGANTGTTVNLPNGTSRSGAIVTGLENNGSTNAAYCQDI